jgi:hypothetical protein
MMFRATFSTITGKSAIHAADCRCATKRPGVIVSTVAALDAKRAAEAYYRDADLEGMGRPKTTVSKCAR